MLQCVAAWCSVVSCFLDGSVDYHEVCGAVWCSLLQWIVVCCSVLSSVFSIDLMITMRCVLQCGVVGCSLLQVWYRVVSCCTHKSVDHHEVYGAVCCRCVAEVAACCLAFCTLVYGSP